MPSAGIASRTRSTRQGGKIGKRSSPQSDCVCSISARRADSIFSKFQVAEGTMSSLICQIALAMSPITSICGK